MVQIYIGILLYVVAIIYTNKSKLHLLALQLQWGWYGSLRKQSTAPHTSTVTTHFYRHQIQENLCHSFPFISITRVTRTWILLHGLCLPISIWSWLSMTLTILNIYTKQLPKLFARTDIVWKDLRHPLPTSDTDFTFSCPKWITDHWQLFPISAATTLIIQYSFKLLHVRFWIVRNCHCLQRGFKTRPAQLGNHNLSKRRNFLELIVNNVNYLTTLLAYRLLSQGPSMYVTSSDNFWSTEQSWKMPPC